MGVGGGTLTVPLLFFVSGYFGIPESIISHNAIASSLIFAFILSLFGSLSNYRQKRISLKDGSFLLIGNIPGAILGSRLAIELDTKMIIHVFSVFLLLSGAYAILKSFIEKSSGNTPVLQKEINGNKFWITILLGFPVGIISSLTGIGGGIMMVPLFHYICKHSIHKAIATSSYAIIFTALTGAAGYLIFPDFTANTIKMPEPSLGYIYLPYIFALIPGGIIGSIMGSLLGIRMKSKVIKISFYLLQIGIGLRMSVI